MKKSLFLFLVVTIAATSMITSCKKYEDGPRFSLRSKKERVANTWKYEKKLKNGAEVSYDQSLRITFDKSGSVTSSYSLGSATGTWSFASDKEEIVVTFVAGGSFIQVASTTTYTILRLKEKELWVKYTDAFGNVIEEHYTEA